MNMPRFFIKIKDMYCEWSTIVDGPISYMMGMDRLLDYIEEEYVNHNRFCVTDQYEIENLMNSLEIRGVDYTSQASSVANVIAGNRAGNDETELTLDEIYERYQAPKDNKHE